MRFCAASDQSMLIYLGEKIGLAVHLRVLKLLRLLQNEPPAWLRNVQPAYCSLMITFDACRVDHAQVESALLLFEQRADALRPPKPRTVEIPVCYDAEFAPDLEDIARSHNLKPKEVVRFHSSRAYHAYFLGFAPGFAYLGDLPDEIATPRLDAPRKKVPAGSVGIAGKQTAIYPFSTPGGWRLIGRTPLPLFRAERNPMELISIGDQVRFRSISRKQFAEFAPS
jgi:inhibitor of KinA